MIATRKLGKETLPRFGASIFSSASRSKASQKPRFFSFLTSRSQCAQRTSHGSATISPTRQRLPERWRTQQQPLRSVRYNSSHPRPNPTPHLNSPPAKLPLKDQLKRLTKEYGRGAVLVYLLFSVADLPVAFGIVQLFGPERVGAAEHAVLGYIKSAWHAVTDPLKGKSVEMQADSPNDKQINLETATVREGIIGDEAVHIAAKARDGQATIWTQLALAYAIHKTLFIFVRIPLTVAFTPSIVKWARARGGFFEWVVGVKKVA